MRRFGPLAVPLVAVVALIAGAQAVSAQETTTFTGQGLDAHGECEDLRTGDDVPAGMKVWQFNLNPASAPATLTASFSDGTVLTDQAPDETNPVESQFKWFVTTAADATVLSVVATHGSHQGNTQLVVSHCTVGPPGEPEKPPEEPEKPPERPPEEVPPGVEEQPPAEQPEDRPHRVEVEIDVDVAEAPSPAPAAPPVAGEPTFTG